MKKKPVKIVELVRFDWFMKHMFRDKSNFDILEGFLSELFGEDITILELLESEGNQNRKDQKINRVDVMVKTANDERVIVEVQNNDEYDYLQRILFGACKTITDNIKRGESYATVKKVISVSIAYFKVGFGVDYIYCGTTSFKGLHTGEELALTEEQKKAFHSQTPADIFPKFYLVQAFDFPDEIKNALDEWVYLLKHSEVPDGFTAKGIEKAKEKLSVAKLNKRSRAAYERYSKTLHDEASHNETQRIRAEMAAQKDKELADAKSAAKAAKQALRLAQKEADKVKLEANKLKQETDNLKLEADKAKAEAIKIQESLQEAQRQIEEATREKRNAIQKALQNGLDVAFIAQLMAVSIAEVLTIKEALG